MAILDNIIAGYPFEGDSADIVGTFDGSDTDVSYGLSYGKISQGLQVSNLVSPADGNANSYVTQADIFNMGTSDYTISLWFKSYDIEQHTGTGGTAEAQILFSRELSGSDRYPRNFLQVGPSGGFWQFGATVSNNQSTSFSYPFLNNVWYHVVLTRASGVCNVYVNAMLAGTSTTVGNISVLVGAVSYFGRQHNTSYPNNDAPFNGNLDEMYVWTRAIAEDEVELLYNNGEGLTYPFTVTPPSTTFIPKAVIF